MIFGDVYITKVGNDILTAAASGKTITWGSCKCCNQSIDDMTDGNVSKLVDLPGQTVAIGRANFCTTEQGEDDENVATISCELSNESAQTSGYAQTFGLYAQCEGVSGLAIVARVGGEIPTYFPTPDQDGKNLLTAFVDISVLISNEAASAVILNQQAYARNVALAQERSERIAGDQRAVTCTSDRGAPYGDDQDIYGRKTFREAVSVKSNSRSFVISKPSNSSCTLGLYGPLLSQNATISFNVPDFGQSQIIVNNDIIRDGDHELISFGTSSMPFYQGFFESFTAYDLTVTTIQSSSINTTAFECEEFTCGGAVNSISANITSQINCPVANITTKIMTPRLEVSDIDLDGLLRADTIQCAEFQGVIPFIDSTSTLQTPKIPIGSIVLIHLTRVSSTTDVIISAGERVSSGGYAGSVSINSVKISTMGQNGTMTSPTGGILSSSYAFRLLCNCEFISSSNEANALAICISSPS